jgi:hypothetical protein
MSMTPATICRLCYKSSSHHLKGTLPLFGPTQPNISFFFLVSSSSSSSFLVLAAAAPALRLCLAAAG